MSPDRGLRVWFVGGGPFAALCLEALNGLLPLERVITGNPTRSGRGLKETPSRVEERALSLGLPLEHTGPLSRNEGLLSALQDAPPDAVFVVDFAQLVKEPWLSAPRWGCLNIHPSLLPRWRGAAPVQRALMNGDPETGVTVFRLVREMDAGPILRQARTPLALTDGASTLYERLSQLGAEIAVAGLRELSEGGAAWTEQDGSRATLAPKLSREEAGVSWSWDAERIHNIVRALDASGGAFAAFRGGRLKLWRTCPAEGAGPAGRILSLSGDGPVVACASGALRLAEVQAEGKRRTGGADWARGLRLQEGDALA